jgi:hypothetical protein
MPRRVERVAQNGPEVLGINISATEGGANMSKIHVLAARLDESGGLVARRIYGRGTMAKNGAMSYLMFQSTSR